MRASLRLYRMVNRPTFMRDPLRPPSWGLDCARSVSPMQRGSPLISAARRSASTTATIFRLEAEFLIFFRFYVFLYVSSCFWLVSYILRVYIFSSCVERVDCKLSSCQGIDRADSLASTGTLCTCTSHGEDGPCCHRITSVGVHEDALRNTATRAGDWRLFYSQYVWQCVLYTSKVQQWHLALARP